MGAASEVILDVNGLVKSYGGAPAVAGISLQLARGEVLTLLGPSGCGKSTTLRLVAGLEEPDDGEIRIRGKVVASVASRTFVPTEKRNLGLVFQSYAIWPHMTVAQNVAYPLEIRGVQRSKIGSIVEEHLALVGLERFGGRRANQLSGGQQQRVALARALSYEPDILLLDEPLSNLDAKLREGMRVQLKLLQRRLHTTILYVTHDQEEAMSLSTRVAVMNAGRIEQLGTPREVYEAPATFFVQSFVGRVLTLPTGAGERRTVRPEDARVLPASEAAESGTGLHSFPGVLEDLIYYGDRVEYLVRVEGMEMLVGASKEAPIDRGTSVVVQVRPDRVKAWAAA